MPGHAAEEGLVLDHAQVERVAMPPDFVAKLRTLLQPGDTLMVTDGSVLAHTTGSALTVVTADPPPGTCKNSEG